MRFALLKGSSSSCFTSVYITITGVRLPAGLSLFWLLLYDLPLRSALLLKLPVVTFYHDYQLLREQISHPVEELQLLRGDDWKWILLYAQDGSVIDVGFLKEA